MTTEAWRDWVERETGRRVTWTRRLKGGLASTVRAVRLDDDRTVVLRSGIQPDDVAHEARILVALERTSIPAPRLLASGDGLLLMTRVPGRVDLRPVDPDGWVRQLAAMLPVIHAAPVDGGPFGSWVDLDAVNADPDAVELARHAPLDERCFIHHDYQHFNVLWSRGTLTGVVDWTYASNGHPDVDVGHCVLNLAILFSAEVASTFRLAYEAEAGRTIDARVEVCELLAYGPGWRRGIQAQAVGVEVDIAGMDDRVAAALRDAIRRGG